MQISTYLPIVLEVLDNNPTLKDSIPARSLQCAYLCEGRIDDAKAQSNEEGYHGIPADIFEELENGDALTYETVGKLMHVSNKKVREILSDVITQVAIRHLESLQKTE
ncbi:MAG: hypothetical protein EOP04_28940 [Proteobacteria bacterium]|nr:MAG: hypothetical protein EOP04_28940 [Pseudomonadota bacterium]